LFVVLFIVATAWTVRHLLLRVGASQGEIIDDGIQEID